ncbi:hypothetical protein HPB47_017210 [Ixodes persulcatus]|uniref:Uncharacterized protein n=1 Tax=Ixodes persulcatus TaxID=34615 RepID=A0AC60QRA9_IXOPE|nr:hypothetical protein HPB47_017210 [Ixodes persulcatus]
MAQRDGTSEWKPAPHLKDRHLDPSHYEKMTIASALAVINHSTGSAIRTLEKEGQMSSAAITTAWFLGTVFKWFRLLPSRQMNLAMSEIDAGKRDDAVEFLAEVLDLFKRLTIQGSGKKPAYKPVQAGAHITTTVALPIQDLYLKENGFRYLYLSRLSQHALENLFSVIGQKIPVLQPV